MNFQFYLTLGYGIGGQGDFPDKNPLLWKSRKPWIDTTPRQMQDMNDSTKSNYAAWMRNGNLVIDYVRVYAV